MLINIIDDAGLNVYTSTDLVMTITKPKTDNAIDMIKGPYRSDVGPDLVHDILHGFSFEAHMLNNDKYTIFFKAENMKRPKDLHDKFRGFIK